MMETLCGLAIEEAVKSVYLCLVSSAIVPAQGRNSMAVFHLTLNSF